jgi:hypothetical protein
MLPLVLSLACAQMPPMPPTMPGVEVKANMKASEAAKLYFLAGDIPTSREWCARGLKKEPKTCGPFLKALAEYAFLVGKFEPLTLDEARQVLELDRVLSPKARGKLTTPVFERFVAGPMARARGWAEQGAAAEAVVFVDDALKVDPGNADAKALRAQLVAAGDGGIPRDGGR